MPASARQCLLACFALCLLVTISISASATSVSVNAFGYLGENSEGVGAQAGFFSAFSAWPDATCCVGFGSVGVPMSLSWSVQTFPGPGFTSVNVGKQFTDILYGGIDFFSATFTIPASALVSGRFTTPVNLSGELQAYQDLTLGQRSFTQGPLMASLNFGGTGTATFVLNPLGYGSFQIVYAYSTFKGPGDLTPVPEPNSLFLIGTGLVFVAATVRRHRPSFVLRGTIMGKC